LCDRVAIVDEGKIMAIDTPEKLIDGLLAKGFTKPQPKKGASLEDVFLDLTGKDLRD
jgi:ABC-2 type transport system ATP-binding protein